jgi:molecular chaperone HtpG
MVIDAQKQTFGFQAEVKKLLDLMIHSLYSNKEIFLRELISNASDAVDKLKFEAFDHPEFLKDDPEFKITVTLDKAAHSVTVSDNGIGMNREEIIDHLGTIAKSGTQKFMENLSGDKARDSQLIGQFGVGFYSSFMIADRVVVTSRRAGAKADEAVCWESKGDGQFTVEMVSKATRGTDVTLYLKEEEFELCDPWALRRIINKYSDHIAFPIMMEKVSESSDIEKNEQGESSLEQVNKASALWTRSKSEITDEEYQEFYKTLSFDYQNPLTWTHQRVEGQQDYLSLLYIPAQAPFDIFDRDQKSGLKLYIQRVYIMDNAEVMPSYLRFVKGVIDSNDLPLNISREILQSNRVLDKIRTASVKKVLNMLSKMAKDNTEDYAKFWKAFGNVVKEGPGEDIPNREAIAELIRFATTHENSDQQTVSFDDYIARMKPEQQDIYYLTAESYSASKNNPLLEIFRKKGVEVVLFYDRVDEWLMSHLKEYKGKKLKSIAKGDLSGLQTEEETKAQEEVKKDFESVLKQMKTVLGAKVKDIRVTSRLTDSPACIVADEAAISIHLQKMLEAAGQAMPPSAPILELNPEHALVAQLKNETDDERFAEWSTFLLEQATLAETGRLEDPASFIKRVNRFLG